MKNRKRDNAEVIEVPSSPEDMSMDADRNRFEVQHRETSISSTGAKSDLQQLTSDQRTLEMEAEIFRLRTALNAETVAKQQGIQEVRAHTRSLARSALHEQQEQFRSVAQQYEQASAEATEAAVHRERSTQQAEQQRQLILCRKILTQVEESVAERESTLHRELLLHQDTAKENVSTELEEQRQVIIQEAENALREERAQLSTVKSEYVQYLTSCQEQAQEGLLSANNTIQNLEHSLSKQEKVQSVLNERIQSMQSRFEDNDRQLKSEIKQMQSSYTLQLRQAKEKETLSAQDLCLKHMMVEKKMNNQIASLRTDLQRSEEREKKLQSQREEAASERTKTQKREMSPISLKQTSNPLTPSCLPDPTGPPRIFGPTSGFLGRRSSNAGSDSSNTNHGINSRTEGTMPSGLTSGIARGDSGARRELPEPDHQAFSIARGDSSGDAKRVDPYKNGVNIPISAVSNKRIRIQVSQRQEMKSQPTS